MLSKGFKFFEPFTKVSVLLLLVVFLFPPTLAHAFSLSFAWDANTEPDIAGYRVFSREDGQNYDYNNPDWEGTETNCTIAGLDDNTTYYFVSRAYDTSDIEKLETFEKCSILFKAKPPACKAYAPEGKAKILTTPVRSAGPTGQADIHFVFRGLKFESDAEIGQRKAFCKGLTAKMAGLPG